MFRQLFTAPTVHSLTIKEIQLFQIYTWRCLTEHLSAFHYLLLSSQGIKNVIRKYVLCCERLLILQPGIHVSSDVDCLKRSTHILLETDSMCGIIRFAVEAAWATTQQVASLRLLHRKPLSTSIPVSMVKMD